MISKQNQTKLEQLTQDELVSEVSLSLHYSVVEGHSWLISILTVDGSEISHDFFKDVNKAIEYGLRAFQELKNKGGANLWANLDGYY